MTPPRSPDHARLRGLAADPNLTPGPWFVQGGIVHGPDHGGVDIGPVLGWHAWADADAAFIAACRDAVPALLAETERLRAALDFRASVEFDNGFHGGDLLRGVAAWMDTVDDARGMAVREVQADLRRWADGIDAALRAATPVGEERAE